MRTQLLMLMVCMALTVVPASAQSDMTPEPLPPWPPDPTELFMENVRWTAVEEANSEAQAVQIVNERRVIQMYDAAADDWREYPFPDDVSTISRGIVQANGLVRLELTQPDHTVRTRFQTGDNILLLDPASGLYEEPPTVCEGRVLQSKPGDGYWIVVFSDPEARQGAFLCHSETGETRYGLPAEITEQANLSLSPDGAWLVMVDRNWEKLRIFDVYAYHLETSELVYLGQVSQVLDGTASVCGWVSESAGLVCRSDMHWYSPGSFFTFDLTHENSIESAFDAWPVSYFRTALPSRFISLFSEDYFEFFMGCCGLEHIPCTFTVFDADGLVKHEVGYDCISIHLSYAMIEEDRAPYYRLGDMIYYLTVESENATVSTLRMYDPTSQRLPADEPLFTGEIESILSVSPDGRYAVLVLDNDGALEATDRPIGLCCAEYRGWQVGIVDLETEQIVYHSEPLGVYTANQVVWLDTTTAVIAAEEYQNEFSVTEEADDSPARTPASLRRVSLGHEATVSVSTIYGQLLALHNRSSSGQYVLQENDSVVDLRTFETVPVLNSSATETYSIVTRWLDDGALEVRVLLPESYDESAVYHVALP